MKASCFAALLFVLCLSAASSAQSEKAETHEHQGKLKPYLSEPPRLSFSEQQKMQLEAGEALFLHQDIDGAQRGVAVFQVNATPDTIWSVIKSFHAYPKWIEDINHTEVYLQRDEFIFVRFTASGLFGETVWYVEHEYPQDDRNWGAWRLDYDYRSDIDDSVGYWRVTKIPGTDNRSQVVYSADLRLGGVIASLFEDSFIADSLNQASIWVKREAELLAEKSQ